MYYDMKKLLAIIYLKTYSEAYQYKELKELLGFNVGQLKEFINKLVEEELIKDNSSLLLTQKSLDILKGMGLKDIDINSLMKEKTSIIMSENKLTFDDIYIPENFKL